MCEAAQHSDQMHCDRCNLTWDMNDPEPPQCLTPTQLKEKIMTEPAPTNTRPSGTPAHYANVYTRNLTREEEATHVVRVKLDPYRICDILKVNGGAREQILKKAIRWDTKGDDERQVIREIMQACERRLEMLDEDEAPRLGAPPAMAPPGARR